MAYIQSTQGLKYYGNYRAYVLLHGPAGKVKLFIPGVSPGATIPSEISADTDYINLLPWAEPAAPIFGGSNNGNGVFSYPNIGSTVWCFFENGDYLRPVYFAACEGGERAKTQYSVARPMPSDPVDDAYVHVFNVGASYIRISETGNITLRVRSSDGNSSTITMNANGNIDIDSTTQITITSPVLRISCPNQISIDTPSFNLSGDVQANIVSPSINLDGSAGGVQLKSSSQIQALT